VGKLRCTLPAAPICVSFFNIVSQYNYVALVDSEEAFIAFTNACAQAGAAECLPVSMIQGNAAGSDVRLLFTSTIDVSSTTLMSVLCKAKLGPTARLEVAEGRIHGTPSPKWGTQE